MSIPLNEHPIVKGWITNFPELETRTELIRYLLDTNTNRGKAFRHRLFSICYRFRQIPFIPDNATALSCLQILYERDKRNFLKDWDNRKDFDNRIVAQAVSVIKETYKNMIREVKERGS